MQNERNADVLAAFQGMRQREKADGGHAVAGIHVGAAQAQGEHTVNDPGHHHEQRAAHEKRRGITRGVVQLV